VSEERVLRLTLDTSSVIHRAQAQPYGPQIDELVELATNGQVGLWITTAFANDQDRAPVDKHQRNLAWLSERPLIGTVPGGFRLDYSRLGVDTVLLSEEQKAVAMTIDEILLPEAYRVGNLQADDEASWPDGVGRQTMSSISSRISSPTTTPSSRATTMTCSRDGPTCERERESSWLTLSRLSRWLANNPDPRRSMMEGE
jgi:hypothetical protein